MISIVKNIDCMIGMKEFEDKYFDLAVVDPPYGIGHPMIAAKQSGTQYGQAMAPRNTYSYKEWDKQIPSKEYFLELKRVSKNQIIWGANYMVEHLEPSMGWIVWDKINGETTFSDCELAYSSFDRALRLYRFRWNGMLQGNMKNKEIRIHPTQKPVALYDWIFTNYSNKGERILDTHLGSGSSRISAYKNELEFYGFEIDEEYFIKQNKRFDNFIREGDLFLPNDWDISAKDIITLPSGKGLFDE